jgi:RHS repeat-associated protein
MGGTLANGTDTTEAYPVAQDVFGFSLHYYKGDYKAIGFTPQATSVLGGLGTNAAPLYNGNIAAMAVNIPKLGSSKVYNYHYDQLNRIVAMDLFNGLNVNAGTFNAAISTDYQERTSYDPNGNILTYLRNGDAARLSMDNLSYFYKPGTNQLHKVTDGSADASANEYSKYNDLRQGQSDNNYQYDPIGNLTSDAKDTLTSINWNVYGKIQSITKNGQVIRYIYDAAGNRIFKYTPNDTTAYVRDASGNVLSVYTRPAGQSPIVQSETHLYGSSRLGIASRHLAADTTIVLSGGFGLGQKSIFTRGEKFFELSNHLGNVLATIADRRIPVDANSDGIIESYKADVVSASDYYPFGMQMPGRKFSSELYRYGFNGKENDNEVKGEGNQQDYGMRIYDGRLGRFLSVDPLTHSYPWYTPYQFAGNQPIVAIDLDGMEPFWGPGNFIWEIWMEWKYGDPTGAKSLVSGATQKASVETRQMTYHNENVPATVQGRLDQVNTNEANVKIARGTGQSVKFNIQTSFDVISTIAPIGKGISVALRGSKIVYGGIQAERVLIGSSEKIAVIGRDFDARVLKFATEFEKQTGKTIETFKASKGATEQWQSLLSKYEGNVPDKIAKSSKIYEENAKWAQKIKDKGYKVFDTGLGSKDGKGTFYGMESKTIFGN